MKLATQARKAAAGLGAALVAGSLFAQDINITDLQGQAKRAEESIASLGPDLMGDRVNLDNGSLEFVQVDTSLPGNNALPVELVRRHTAGRTTWIKREFGNWDLELPRISGNFSTKAGWLTSTNGTNRCSNYSAPPSVTVTVTGGGGPPVAPAPPGGSTSVGGPTSQRSSTSAAATTVSFIDLDYWQGIHISAGGQSVGEVVKRHSSNTAAPSDGYSYPLVTKSGWQIRCTVNAQNAAGEGFVALSPDGTQYRFDWMVSKNLPTLRKEGAGLTRSEISLYATLVTDRFGNTVTYTFNPSNAAQVKSIASSDGRKIDLTHDGAGRVATVYDGTRKFVYSYDTNGDLYRVTRPDSSYWEFNLRPMVHPIPMELGEGGNCQLPGAFPEGPLTGTIRHPSGAVGTFETRFVTHGRANVTQWCLYVGTKAVSAVWPRYLVTQGLASKTLTGVGLGSLTWRYAYSGGTAGWAPCSYCSDRKYTQVTDPQNNTTQYTFGNRFQFNEGQLLAKEEGWDGTAWLRTTNYRYREPAGMSYPEPVGTSASRVSEYSATRHRPEDLQAIVQQSVTFSREVLTFDTMARPVDRLLSSTLGYSKTETTGYFDHRAKWVMGQIASTSVAGMVPQSFSYDPTTATRTASYSFGRLVESYTWNPDGTLYQRLDPLNRPTTFANYRRGIARLITRRDNTQESAEVNNLGRLDSYTNAARTTTSFTYDAMGRVASVSYPSESTGSYHPRTHQYEVVPYEEYGLPAGHWRQTISIGNARTIHYYDAMWRVGLTRTFDAANEAATSRFTEYRYDPDGKKLFESYPQRTIATLGSALPGTTWWYDALNRVIADRKDSELGALDTTTKYLPKFQKRVTNPRQFSTTTLFQAFDEPTEQFPTTIDGPEGATVTIARDALGLPSAVTRGGPWAGGSLSVTRQYVYDPYRRLCKTIEPETGATIQDYDAAGNVAWRAPGLNLPSGNCDQGSVTADRKIEFRYDALDRLSLSLYGDGSPSVTRTYTPDGLDYQVSSGGVTWTYYYNNRRLLKQEDFSPGWSFFHGIDAYGHRNSLTYPDGYTTSYSPNALGEPTQVSGYLNGVTYHPNGKVAGYTLTNGISHSVSLNTRGLPNSWRDAGVLHDLHSYDANGNVQAIADGLGSDNRSMAYDGLDRLTSATGVWGSAGYGYDPVDNLRSSVVGSRALNHNFDPATNRLTSLSGSQSVGFDYDANGNVRQRGAQAFGFDLGNRLRSALGKATYEYDGHGRRTRVAWADGSTQLNAYAGTGSAGRLLFSSHSTRGTTRYLYLDSQLIAEQNSVSGVSFAHTDALGSVVSRTNASGQVVGARTRYEPYGATAAGETPRSIGFTGHVNDGDTGLVYMQQRYYDPVAGRFLSVDSVETDSEAGESFNRYAYVSLNPYRYVDPDGRDKWGAEESCRPVELRSDTVNIITITGTRGGASSAVPVPVPVPVAGGAVGGTPSALSPGGMGNVLRDFMGISSLAVGGGAAGTLRFGIAAKGTAEITKKAPVVIGESMKDRVIPAAEEIGGHVYKPRGGWTAAKQARWAKEMKRQIDRGERDLVDIGRDPERAVPSEAYKIERQIFYGE